MMRKIGPGWHHAMIIGLILLSACSGQLGGGAATPTTAATLTPVIPVTSGQNTSQTATIGVAATSTAGTQPSATPAATVNAPAIAVTSANCTNPATLTPAVTEGPYFKVGSPEQAVLAKGMAGTQLILTGYVMTIDCQPVSHALLDFWQADAQGNYDNSGYTLRGHQYTDANGRFQLATVVPGLYPGRTEHIHVKVQAPNGPMLTTQLFFPGVTQNDADGIFDPRLLMTVQQASAAWNATYTFVVATK